MKISGLQFRQYKTANRYCILNKSREKEKLSPIFIEANIIRPLMSIV